MHTELARKIFSLLFTVVCLPTPLYTKHFFQVAKIKGIIWNRWPLSRYFKGEAALLWRLIEHMNGVSIDSYHYIFVYFNCWGEPWNKEVMMCASHFPQCFSLIQRSSLTCLLTFACTVWCSSVFRRSVAVTSNRCTSAAQLDFCGQRVRECHAPRLPAHVPWFCSCHSVHQLYVFIISFWIPSSCQGQHIANVINRDGPWANIIIEIFWPSHV